MRLHLISLRSYNSYEFPLVGGTLEQYCIWNRKGQARLITEIGGEGEREAKPTSEGAVFY